MFMDVLLDFFFVENISVCLAKVNIFKLLNLPDEHWKMIKVWLEISLCFPSGKKKKKAGGIFWTR